MSGRRTLPLSILDLAIIGKGQTARDGLDDSVALAQRAEAAGYRAGLVRRAPQHGVDRVVGHQRADRPRRRAHRPRSASAPAASCCRTTRRSTIAEQFGTLATLHPGRIDLGLGRAPGSDQNTMRALRRDPHVGRHVPRRTCSSCRATSAGESRIAGRGRHPRCRAPTCRSTSSGRRCSARELAAALGLPYAFASHFAPERAAGGRSPSTGASSDRRNSSPSRT